MSNIAANNPTSNIGSAMGGGNEATLPLAPPLTANSIVIDGAAGAGPDVPAGNAPDLDLLALADNEAATTLVRDYLGQREITVKFDGSFEAKGDLREATDVAQTAPFLRQIELTYTTILEHLAVICTAARIKKSALKVALNRELRARRQERYAMVLENVLRATTDVERADVPACWDRISTLFETDPKLTIGVLKHFIWQVKRKVLGLVVTEHLMPIVFSERQGTGKTTFARKFLTPIAELASDPVALADVADIRSGDIFRYPVILIDDIDAVTVKDTHLLKTVMSSRKIRRRILQTSDSVAYRQNATFFGTSNKDVVDIVPDETGHRRFAMLPFRDGIERPELRTTINQEIDYDLLWRSVDPWATSPIEECLNQLREHQGFFREDQLCRWLFNLDVESEDVKQVLTAYGVQARDLYDLLCAQTKIELSEKAFGSRMRYLLREPQSPFDRKRRRRDAYYYQLRAK